MLSKQGPRILNSLIIKFLEFLELIELKKLIELIELISSIYRIDDLLNGEHFFKDQILSSSLSV